MVIVGLSNSGKTTLLQVLADGCPVDTVPTVGLNVKMIKKGGVSMKCWDLAGSQPYRNDWGRYTKGCNAIIFVVDANALHLLPEAKKELHKLLDDPELSTTPLLIVSNKIDLEPRASESQLIKELNLDYIVDNPWMIIPCSALRTTNIDAIVKWLVAQSNRK